MKILMIVLMQIFREIFIVMINSNTTIVRAVECVWQYRDCHV